MSDLATRYSSGPSSQVTRVGIRESRIGGMGERSSNSSRNRESKGGFLSGLKGISQKDLSIFTWQLYTMTDAGVPLIRSLNSIIVQTRNKRLKKVLGSVVDDINKGMSFSEALRRHPRAFSPFLISMIEVGEVGGALDGILKDVAAYYETVVERRSKIISALSYPILLLCGCFGVMAFLLLFLVPRLFTMFDDIGSQIPMTTQLLVNIGTFARQNIYYILGGVAGVIVALRYYSRTASGRYAVDSLLLRIPIFGAIIKKIILSRFSNSLSIMTNSGVPLLGSLRITRDIVGNHAVKRVVDDLIEGVSEGESINEVLSRHPLIPDMVVNMVAVGEETGTLSVMLTKVSEYYDREVSSAVSGITKVIEPVLLAFMAVVVGFIAISILDPVTDLITNMNR